MFYLICQFPVKHTVICSTLFSQNPSSSLSELSIDNLDMPSTIWKPFKYSYLRVHPKLIEPQKFFEEICSFVIWIKLFLRLPSICQAAKKCPLSIQQQPAVFYNNLNQLISGETSLPQSLFQAVYKRIFALLNIWMKVYAHQHCVISFHSRWSK